MIEYQDLIDSIRLDEVLDNLGIDIVEIRKGEHWSSCPLSSHPGSDAKPSWSVNEDSLVYNCFVCGGGSLPMLVKDVLGLDSWDDAVEWLLPYSDGDTDTDEGFMKQLGRYLERLDEKPTRSRHVELPYYSEIVLEKLPDAPVALLAKWGINEIDTVEHFGVRFDKEHVRGSYTGPAIIIPHWFGGKLVGYQERWLEEKLPKHVRKYTNSDDFPRAETIYGWDDAVQDARRGTPVIVVESTMTVMRLWELGYAAVATFGASVSDAQIRLLRSLDGGVMLTQDNDPSYRNARGEMIVGAGRANVIKVANALTDFIPVELIPPAEAEKGDLADLQSNEIHKLIGSSKPVFAALAAPKG